MPDIVLHNEMGKRVYERLNEDIKASIVLQVFRFGLMAPDAYMSYRFFLPHFRRGINKYGKIMHEAKCKDFFVELAKNCNDNQSFSMLCGFLCHFALDSTIHPLINQMADGRAYVHTAIEHTLDMIELHKVNQTSGYISNYFTPYYESPQLMKSIRAVYGFNDYLRTAYNHQQLYYRVCCDKYGLIELLFGQIEGKLSAFSYNTKICEGMDFTKLELQVNESIEYAYELIDSAYSFYKKINTEGDFSDLIGNRTYVG